MFYGAVFPIVSFLLSALPVNSAGSSNPAIDRNTTYPYQAAPDLQKTRSRPQHGADPVLARPNKGYACCCFIRLLLSCNRCRHLQIVGAKDPKPRIGGQ